ATGAGVIREAIAVAVANSQDRIDEYTPATDPRWPGGGRAALYVDFLVRELKPRIDAEFRTLADRAQTAIIGSSLGGLVSLYAGVAAAETFGLVGALSPVLDWAGYDIEWRYAAATISNLPQRVWVDMGTAEDHGEPRHIGDLRRFCSVLERRGYERGRTHECAETPLC